MSLQANAYNARVQGDLWNPAKNGVLWRGATAEANTKVSDWNLRKKYASSFDRNFKMKLEAEFQSLGRQSTYDLKRNSYDKTGNIFVDFIHEGFVNAWNNLDYLKSAIPLTSM